MSNTVTGTSNASVVVHPVPTDEEAAAIVAATEALWPRPMIADAAPGRRPTWRFSGRWWSVPLPARRPRPWI